MFMSLFLSISYSIPVLVNIKESLEGYFPYFNYTISGDIIALEVVWENIGSVTCDTYLRLKVIADEKERNFWSEKVNIPPGGSGLLRVYSFLPDEDLNNITIIPYFYYCNEIKRLGNISLMNYNSTSRKIDHTNTTWVRELSNKNMNISYEMLDEENILLNFRINTSLGNKSFKELYIIPLSPYGWILPTKKISLNNKSAFNTTYSFYKPDRSSCCTNFLFILKDSENQYFYMLYNMNLTYFPTHPKDGYDIKNVILYTSIILNVLLLVSLMWVLYKNKRKREPNSKETLLNSYNIVKRENTYKGRVMRAADLYGWF